MHRPAWRASATTSSTSAAVTWAVNADDGGSAVTGYTVTSSPAVATPAACSTSLTGTSTGCTFTGLTKGTTYTFTVSAINAVGTGLASAATELLKAGTPGAPTGVTGTSGGATQSVVSWAVPAADGGSPVAGYTVTADPGRPHLHRQHHELHGDRPDRRHRVPVHGHGHQHHRSRPALGPVGPGDLP